MREEFRFVIFIEPLKAQRFSQVGKSSVNFKNLTDVSALT